MNRVAVAILAGALAACSVFTSQSLSRLRDAEMVACFIAHAALPSNEAIATACMVGPEFTDMIARIVGEHRASMQRELHNAGRCRPSITRVTPPLREHPNGDKDRLVELW